MEKQNTIQTIAFIDLEQFKTWYTQEIIPEDEPEIQNLIYRASSEIIAMANKNNLIIDYRDNLITIEDRYFIDTIALEITAKFYDMGVDKAITSTSSTFGSKAETYSFDNDNALQERSYNLLAKTKYYTSEVFETAFIMEGMEGETTPETDSAVKFKTGEEVGDTYIEKTEDEGGSPTLITANKVDEKILASKNEILNEIADLQTQIDNIEDDILDIVGDVNTNANNIDNLYSIVAQTGEKQLSGTIPAGLLNENLKTKIMYSIVDNEFDPDITYLNGNFTNNSAEEKVVYIVLEGFFDNSNPSTGKTINLYVDNETTATTLITGTASISSTGLAKAIAKITIPAGQTIATYYLTPTATGTLNLTQGDITMTGGTPIVVQLENYVLLETISGSAVNRVENYRSGEIVLRSTIIDEDQVAMADDDIVEVAIIVERASTSSTLMRVRAIQQLKNGTNQPYIATNADCIITKSYIDNILVNGLKAVKENNIEKYISLIEEETKGGK